jgi:hypothetical protein
MARPRFKLQLIASYVRTRERATAREIAHGVQMSIGDTTRWLSYLQEAGELEVVDRVWVDYSKRPGALYGPPIEAPQFELNALTTGDWLRR